MAFCSTNNYNLKTMDKVSSQPNLDQLQSVKFSNSQIGEAMMTFIERLNTRPDLRSPSQRTVREYIFNTIQTRVGRSSTWTFPDIDLARYQLFLLWPALLRDMWDERDAELRVVSRAAAMLIQPRLQEASQRCYEKTNPDPRFRCLRYDFCEDIIRMNFIMAIVPEMVHVKSDEWNVTSFELKSSSLFNFIGGDRHQHEGSDLQQANTNHLPE